jgi:addiction module RelE/StbE family toxin
MRVRWTQSATQDLGKIFRFIRKDSLEAARRVKARLSSEVAALGATPLLGRPGEVDGTRELFLAWSYIAVYMVVRDEVVVLRIRHGAQRWPPVG